MKGDRRKYKMDSLVKAIDGDCRTVFMVEIKLHSSKWGAIPKIFYTKEEADKEAEASKLKYPFSSKCRVVTRIIEEKQNYCLVSHR
jgi:hypothetical protein